MKKILTISGILLINIFYAQKTNCSQLEQELTNKTSQIDQLQKQVEYYKETLDLLKPISTVSLDGMTFSITKAIGSVKNKTINFIFTYQNTDSTDRKFFQCEQAFGIDPQGNQLQSYEVFVGANNGIRVENIKPNIPTKATLIFKTTEINFPIIRILKIKIYSNDSLKNGTTQDLIFENIPLTWE